MTVEDRASNTDYLKEMQKVSHHWTIGTIWRENKNKTKNKNRHFRKLTVQFWIIVHIPGLVPAMRATSPTYQRPINMI